MATANNSLVKQQQKIGLTAYLTQEGVKKQISEIIGKNSETFMASIISAVQTNPSLQECTNSSILSGALLGESLKLSPSPQLGHFYLVPYKDNKQGITQAQFLLSYKGYIQLAIRSGQNRKLNVVPIKQGELIKFDALNEDIEVNMIDDEEAREKLPTIGYYAMFELVNGFRKAMFWSKAKMEAHANKYSSGYRAKKGYTFWEKDFDSMACKTMLRQLISKWGIMSIELQKAYDADMAVIKEDGTKVYVDNVEIEQAEAEAPKEEPKKEVDAQQVLFS